MNPMPKQILALAKRDLAGAVRAARPVAIKAGFVAALSIGAWSVLVRPIEERSAQARAQSVALSTRLDEFQSRRDQRPAIAMQHTILEEHAGAINRWAAPNADDATIYRRLGELAAERGLRLARVEPRQVASSSRSTRSESEVAISYAISLEGPFARVASFIDDIETRLGATSVAGFRVTQASPGSGSQHVAVTIETRHARVLVRTDAAGDTP